MPRRPGPFNVPSMQLSRHVPGDWYWTADDGRIFASARQTLVPADDPEYLRFLQTSIASIWPRDDTGQQTDASLQAVFPNNDIFVNDMYYAANQRWRAESGGMTITGIASAPNGMPIKTDDRSKNLVGLAASAAQADKQFSTVWVGSDWINYALTNDEIIAMAQQLLLHVDACFQAYSDAISKIQSKAITERKQIDDMFARLRAR